MYAFRFNHIHWLWNLLHWMRHGIYAPVTFCVVVFIGLAQTVIGWESGELAVKALPIGALSQKDQKRYLRLVRVLAVLLFPATFFVGVANDRSLRDADEKAQKVQDKLDQADARAVRFGASFDAFVKTLDPSKLTVTQFARLSAVYRDAPRVTVPTPAPATNPTYPLSQMSDGELRGRVLEFVTQLRNDDNQMLDMQDVVNRTRASRTTEDQSVIDQRVAEQTGQLNAIISDIILRDVPRANDYRAELLRRLGPKAGVVKDFLPVAPAAVPLDRFLYFAMYQLSDLAVKLPTSN